MPLDRYTRVANLHRTLSTLPRSKGMALIVEFPQQHMLPIKMQPRVSFLDHAKVTFIENLSFEYKADIWFSSQEMELFKTQVARILHSISSSGMSIAQYAEMHVNDTSTFMGLENYLSQNTSQNIRDRREAIWRAVRLEQARQIDAGICDPHAMAVSAGSVSEKSRTRARIIGLLHYSSF
mmetsp:Transcript_9580/g.17565  ORF Transcript_9580/g.17565 Transcript_9580/m.17565 type:complete len:180 (+) Transcript_9580:13-552(+)|eukprot:CAMPEP_0196134144 /NCGR_PEP_ID=MMETSP0910-20130528/3107_1 /TAXON_ID=49265 /ORGANISM="Thalassiosira rotula, Strain GSO102" /LENGTH=179 /DNA_ID=CAMNT_0041393961 /DNA_START=1 /DNA_END=540 /DNA_ORIENTATION=+